ncbi:chemotaxis protein MotA [Oceanospirillum multiglobuliferum]|uniref:Flagellar motor stator protein MotA n=1 Tax=Oceanospirillum multiglobuliferum TaxID=64969 RepID=A0A1T4RHJ6_9GAMM|nr:flagellar motor stator protein MotA [Oceanospirillum multiglobuliferum]OPX54781.1 flagellar motor stator protein MotA [Oceanospirillum multiglobuliferum]SKA15472.1 chemotaxis protein MotA [Oceanospirillum multiglobuliferum]
MLLIIGSLIVLASVGGGYVLSHGYLPMLWQPYEMIIICGAALGGFVISNSKHTLIEVFKSLPKLITGSGLNKALFMDLLSLMYDLFTKIRKEGVIAVEADIEEPDQSPIFAGYPAVFKHKVLIEFVCDYMRLISSGNMQPHELESLMDAEIETIQHELEEPAHAVTSVADALPGFGIVAAVLGITITMRDISAPPEVLGMHIAAALVGTFLGILLSYGFVGPTAIAMKNEAHEKVKAFECVKACLIANMNGLPPQMAVEFGRKMLFSSVRPSFNELEEHVRSR